jgi:hypothetical protein
MVAPRTINIKTAMAYTQILHIILGDGNPQRALVARIVNEAISNTAVNHDSDINRSTW